MTSLITIFFGTVLLGYLSNRYYPPNDKLPSGRSLHFMRDKTDFFLLIIIIWFSLFNGLKTSYNDTVHYIEFFEDAATTLTDHFATSSETGFADNPLYYICEVLVKGLIDNYHVWFLLVATFGSVIIVKFFRRYSVSLSATLLVFLAIGTYIMYLAAMKQSIAVAILMLAIPYLLDHKWIKYYLLVFLAILFHTHAFLFLFLPLFLVKPWGIRTYICIAAMAFAMATYDSTLGAFMEYAQSIGANVAEIEVFDNHQLNSLRVAVYAIVPILTFLFRGRLFYNSTETENLFVNMSILSCLILAIGLVEGGNLFARMAGYFEIGTALCFPWVIKKLFTKNSQSFIFICAGLLYFIYFLYEFGISKNFGADYNAITLWQFFQTLLP